MVKSICLCAVLACTATAAAVDVTLRPEGGVSIGDAELHPIAFLSGWRGAVSKGGYELGDDGVARFRMEDLSRRVFDASVSLVQLGERDLRIDCRFAATAASRLESIGLSMSLPVSAVEGRGWCAGAVRGVFKAPEKGIHLAGGRLSTFEFAPPGVASHVCISTTNDMSYLVQDSRKWGGGYTLRFGRLGRCAVAEGDVVSFSVFLSCAGGLKAAFQRPYVISRGAEWVPLDYRRDIVEGSALDFSQMGFTDAPAGKHGWLRNVGGHFEFENLPGRPQRFYGVNFCGTANFPDHALAETLVTRLKRLGYNALRLHHHDAGTVAGSADGLTLNAEQMDRFDYLVAAAMREGLYVTTDLYVSRRVKWRDIGIDRDGAVDNQHFKALCAVYEPAYANWAAYARNFLLHENKYTGRRYADDPAMPLISLVNEGGFFMGWNRGVKDDPRIVSSWSAWLAERRRDDPGFAKGMGGDKLPDSFWNAKAQPIVVQWMGELEAKMSARMKAHLRSLGAKALITNDNCGPHNAALQRASAAYDYIDDHFYVDHPDFPEKRWTLPSRCANENPLLGGKPLAPSTQAYSRMLDKPFTITEWNFSGPGRYRGIGGILTGAMAALQDWDGLWRFAYSHSRDKLGDADVRSPTYFDLAADPLAQAGERACLCLFMRGDLKPLADGVALWDTSESASSQESANAAAPKWRDAAWTMRVGSCLSPEGARGLRVVRREDAGDAVDGAQAKPPLVLDRERGAFTIDTPCTCGGFAPEGVIDAGALRATVRGAPATVWVSSLDGADIAKSKRMLLTHVTDVQGEGAKFTDERMKTTLKWGGRPLVRIGAADVEIEMIDPAECTVYELDTAGRRKRRMPCAAKDGRLCLEVSTKGPDGGRVCYEMVKQ